MSPEKDKNDLIRCATMKTSESDKFPLGAFWNNAPKIRLRIGHLLRDLGGIKVPLDGHMVQLQANWSYLHILLSVLYMVLLSDATPDINPASAVTTVSISLSNWSLSRSLRSFSGV